MDHTKAYEMIGHFSASVDWVGKSPGTRIDLKEEGRC